VVLPFAHIEYRLSCQTFAGWPNQWHKRPSLFIPVPARILQTRDIFQKVIRRGRVIPEKKKRDSKRTAATSYPQPEALHQALW